MAKKIEVFDWDSAKKRSGGGGARPAKYPWDEWLDGSIWQLTGGEDFTGNVDAMRSAVQSKIELVPNVGADEVAEILATYDMPDPLVKTQGTVTLQVLKHSKASPKGKSIVQRRENAAARAAAKKAEREASAATAAPKPTPTPPPNFGGARK